VRYIKWRKPRGGPKRENGEGRLCGHCSRTSTQVCVSVGATGLRMDMYYCDEHAEEARQRHT